MSAGTQEIKRQIDIARDAIRRDPPPPEACTVVEVGLSLLQGLLCDVRRIAMALEHTAESFSEIQRIDRKRLEKE